MNVNFRRGQFEDKYNRALPNDAIQTYNDVVKIQNMS